MVNVGDSSYKGCEFESLHCILDGQFSPLFVVNIVMCVWKDKINEKVAEVGPFLKKTC